MPTVEPMIDEVEPIVHEGLSRWTGQSASTISWDVTTGDTSIRGLATLDGLGPPQVVVKIARFLHFNDSIVNERRRLQELEGLVDGRLGHPRSFALEFLRDGRAAHFSSFCEGASLIRRLGRTHLGLKGMFGDSATWLGTLHRLTSSEATGDEPPATLNTVHAVSVLSSSGMIRGRHQRSLAAAAQQWTTRARQSPSTVVIHGDFWPGNCVQTARGRLAAFDWETSAWGADATLDVYLFPIAAARVIEEPAAPHDLATRVLARLDRWRRHHLPRYLAEYDETCRGRDWLVLAPEEGLLATCVLMASRTLQMLGPEHTDTAFWCSLLQSVAVRHSPG